MRHSFNLFTRTNQLIIDGGIFCLSFAASYVIRFEGFPAAPEIRQFLLCLPFLVSVRLLTHWRSGIYRFVWRFVSLSDVLAIARSLSVVSVVLLALRLFYPAGFPLSATVRLPLTVITLEFLLSLTGSLSARALRRVLYEKGRKSRPLAGQRLKRVVLYGAGRAGILLLKELRTQSNFEVVGFVDDDQLKVGMVVSGVDVLGNGEALAEIVRRWSVDEVVIAMATASRSTLLRIRAKCDSIPISAKIIPSLQEIVEGRLKVSQLRDIRIDDLLGRESVQTTRFDHEVQQAYARKRILVTGAGGSIGSELVRQLLLFAPSRLGMLDKDENSIYELDQAIRFRDPRAPVEPVIADVRHCNRLWTLLEEFKPQVVFHAAAHKHVPLMEGHPCEAVLNNVGSSKILFDACLDEGVECFVFISTDKAVNPTNVMGATKRVGEMLVQAGANGSAMRSASVRFGNVMGSRGSVIPLFQKQIAEGGPVTVTHPEVVRFLMTIPEAVGLVLCAGALARHGELFVLDMGSPRKILDLAEEMIRLSGLQPRKDIEIAITGLRPGEKLSEELTGTDETLCSTRFGKLFRVVPAGFETSVFFENVAHLVRAAEASDCESVHEILCAMGIGYKPQLSRVSIPVH
jgi:FlaA1/EpsC-like NDP-sugar epimerase